MGGDANFFYDDMSEEAANLSPRMFVYDSDSVAFEREQFLRILRTPPEKTTKALQLINNYFKIPSPQLAQNVFELLKILSQYSTYYIKKQRQP